MKHRHKGPKVKYRRKGRIRYRKRPKHLMSKHRNKSYKQLRRKYKIHPLADDDKDKVRNYKDCRPWNKKRHGIWFDEEEPEDFEEQLKKYKEEKKQERARREASALEQDPELIEQLAFEVAKGEHRREDETS